jgi:hypothetical protein
VFDYVLGGFWRPLGDFVTKNIWSPWSHQVSSLYKLCSLEMFSCGRRRRSCDDDEMKPVLLLLTFLAFQIANGGKITKNVVLTLCDFRRFFLKCTQTPLVKLE